MLDGMIYLICEEGCVVFVKVGFEFEIVVVNNFGEYCLIMLVILEGVLYVCGVECVIVI